MVIKEEQYLREIWLLPIILGLSLFLGLILLVRDLSGDTKMQGIIALTIVTVVMGIVFWLLVTMKLETRLDEWGLSFRSPPFINSWKKYPWDTIQRIEPVVTQTIWGIVGIGIRYSLRGEWRFIFSVRHAVRIHLKNRSFVLSTRRPKEIMSAWENWKFVN